ncbi:MAG: NAD(P)/FAD-dependent oxidoreductase [Ktedonobacterales bacterium]
MGSTSFWQAECLERKPGPVGEMLQGEQHADVAIIGAGITGTSLALWLAREGVCVSVVEARRVAAGASGRNGGFLLAGTAETYSEAIARYGHERARRTWAFSVANHALAEQLVAELEAEDWPSGHRQTGSLRIACSQRELDEINASIPLLREDGWRAEAIGSDYLPECLRASYLGGAYYPVDGEIQPARFVTGIARLACNAGAMFYEESPVESLGGDAGVFAVQCARGALHAPSLVLATNAWLPDAGVQLGVEWLAGTITPTRGQVLTTAPVAERLFTCPCYADDGYQYWRQLEDGRLVVGGWRNHSLATEYTSDETPGDEVQRHLDAFVRETLRLPDAAVERRWAGIMAFSRDGLPLVGPLPGVEHAYIAGGYTGHGNAYALRASRVVADIILGRTHPDADLFDPARFV